MSLYDFGLSFLEKNTPSYKIEDPSIGIVTATDSNTFVGVQTLYSSIKGKINFTCYDIGLNKEELRWANSNGMSVVKFKKKINRIDKWQTYLKPFFIKESPYEYTIWIDSDCIVSGDLSTSEFIVNKKTFFVEHWINEKHLRRNCEELYKRYPVKGSAANINAGVFAINKTTNSDIIDEWIYLVDIVLQQEEVRKLTVHWDEGCLLWAIRKTNNGNLIINDYRYNCQTDTTQPNEYELASYEKPTVILTNNIIPSKFFREVIDSKVFVNHFSTCMENKKKYWNKWIEAN